MRALMEVSLVRETVNMPVRSPSCVFLLAFVRRRRSVCVDCAVWLPCSMEHPMVVTVCREMGAVRNSTYSCVARDRCDQAYLLRLFVHGSVDHGPTSAGRLPEPLRLALGGRSVARRSGGAQCTRTTELRSALPPTLQARSLQPCSARFHRFHAACLPAWSMVEAYMVGVPASGG